MLNNLDLIDLINGLLRSSNDSSRNSPKAILNALMSGIPLKACSFYSYNETNKVLSLRSQIGMDYTTYKSFQLPLDSTAGRCIQKKIPLSYQNVRSLPDYRDTELINKYDLQSLITIPLVKESCSVIGGHEICDPVLGVICFYPESSLTNDELTNIEECINKLSFAITQAYIHSVNYDQLRIRTEIFQFALSSTDLSSFCHRLCKLLRNNWGYGGVSIFLLDERSSTLQLKGTTGLNQKQKKIKTFYRLDENEDIAKVFETGDILIEEINSDNFGNKKYTEAVIGNIVASLCLPVFEPKTPFITKNKKAGVMRITNNTIAHDGTIEAVSFGWEDLSLLSFVATIIGVITHLFTKVSRMTEDFERAIHGIQNNLLFVNTSLNQLLERSGIMNSIDPIYIYHIPDCIDHVEALTWQMERFIHGKNPGEIACVETKLAGDVLTKLSSIHRSMTKFYNVIPEPGPIFDHSKILKIPTVYGEEEALITVFRNLTENSVKYSSRTKKLKTWVNWKVEGNHLMVDFIDNGIGIEEVDVDYIFSEGYKAENAMRRSTVGAGLGLFQCKKILKQLNGDIWLKKSSSPTIFTVKLQLWDK